MDNCEKCGELLFGRHHCEEFEVIAEDEKRHKIWAYDEEDALLKYAKWINGSYDYRLINGEATVELNNNKYIVSVETAIRYYVREIKEMEIENRGDEDE